MAPSQTPLAELIRGRRTINDFRPGRPSDDLVLQAIELARWAPNHKLTQPWRFHLVGERTAEAIIDLNTRLVAAKEGPEAGAAKRRRWSAVPGWLAVTCVRSPDPLREREDYAACCCAIQNLSLYLWSEGIGVKWSTGPATRSPEFLALLGLPAEGHSVVGLLWYGRPERVPTATRRNVDEILQVLP
jgi:nitroreductase